MRREESKLHFEKNSSVSVIKKCNKKRRKDKCRKHMFLNREIIDIDDAIERLLLRPSMQAADKAEIEYYAGKTVLVTGGGGSIGSELCRQIAKCSPRCIIIFDIYENNAYYIQQELLINANFSRLLTLHSIIFPYNVSASFFSKSVGQ